VETGDPAPVDLPRGNGQLILIADDEQMVRQIVKTALEAYDYRVITANDGTDALSKFAVHQTELAALVMDLEMPHLNGITCLQAMRRINASVPVLIVSGANATDVPHEKIKALGATFLAKPFNKTDLLTAINGLFEPVTANSE
jgi:DNA-binding response OmpR family regulator